MYVNPEQRRVFIIRYLRDKQKLKIIENCTLKRSWTVDASKTAATHTNRGLLFIIITIIVVNIMTFIAAGL